MRPLKCFQKEFKMEKFFVFHPSDLIIVASLKNMFSRAFAEHGIFHNFSSPRTPQQNRVVERKNRSLQEMT